ncbi:MAG: hypothetical protein AABX93_01405 [Nanoarchaeota archaeon]
MFESGDKRGQITIFVVVGILVVSGVILFFLYNSNILPEIGGRQETNVNAFLNTCLEEKTKEAVKELSLRGGDLNSKLHVEFKFMEDGVYRNISYLCYTENKFRPCVSQKPTIFLDIQNNIKDYISSDVESCFEEMLSDFKRQGFEVSSDSRLIDFDVKLMPKKVSIQTNSEVTLTKSDETTTQKNFQVNIQSGIYDFAFIVQEIVNGEAQFCYFEDTGFEVAYPEFRIGKFEMTDQTKIYTIENVNTGDKFRFATKGCVTVPGF